MFRNEHNFSKVTLGESYNKNYNFLIENNKSDANDGIQLFNSMPIFKYKKLALKYDKMPSEDQLKFEIQRFLDKFNINETFKVFSIKGNVFKNNEGAREYVVNVVFVNFNL